MRLIEDDLRGKMVMSAEGSSLGQVTNVVVESETWNVDALRVRLHKEIADRLGVDRSIFRKGTIDMPVRMVHSVGDAIVLNIALDQLQHVLTDESEQPVAH